MQIRPLKTNYTRVSVYVTHFQAHPRAAEASTNLHWNSSVGPGDGSIFCLLKIQNFCRLFAPFSMRGFVPFQVCSLGECPSTFVTSVRFFARVDANVSDNIRSCRKEAQTNEALVLKIDAPSVLIKHGNLLEETVTPTGWNTHSFRARPRLRRPPVPWSRGELRVHVQK